MYERYLDFGSLVKGGRLTPRWLPDGSSFWYAQGEPNCREIVKVDPGAGTIAPLFDVARLRAALHEALGYEPAGVGVPFTHLEFAGPERVAFLLDAAKYELDLSTYQLVRLRPPATYSTELVRSEAERAEPRTFMRERFWGLGKLESPESASPDGRWIVGVEGGDLLMRATVDGQTVRIPADDAPHAFWDVESVLWNPWSPDGQHLAVFKQNTAGMARVPSIEWLKPLERARQVVLIPAGGTLYRSELYLVDTRLQSPRLIDLGDTEDQYVRILSWLSDSSGLILARYNRVFSRVDIQTVNVATGAMRQVLTEESATFLSNHHAAIWGTDTGFSLLPDGSGFIWRSERNGWAHLYLYDMHGRLVRQLTDGAWPARAVVRVDQCRGWVYFLGHRDERRPYDTHLYRVRLDGNELTQLTEGKGQHCVEISPLGQYFTDTYSAVDVPPTTVLRRTDGALVRSLSEADLGALQRVGWVAPQEHVVKAADGATDLWATLYLPHNFDPGKRYPLIEYIYAGPQCTWRPMDFGDQPRFAGLARQQNFNRALAQLGFLVLVLDARGTPGRSKAFHDAVYRNWGQCEVADHVGAIRQLSARLRCIDLDRVGIWGASWGGHFAFRALTQAPDLYKAGICQVPGFDARRLMLYEPYLGLPRENKAAYDAADVFALAPNLKGELLLIGGTNDPSTLADLFKMSETLIRLGKQHRLMLYPNSGHGALGATAEYDMELKKRFFVECLNPGGR